MYDVLIQSAEGYSKVLETIDSMLFYVFNIQTRNGSKKDFRIC